MKHKKRFLIATGLFILFLSFVGPSTERENRVRTLSLLIPDVLVAEAKGTTAPETVIQSAGISAYFNANMTINLSGNLLRNQFRTIESETPEFLIGSIAVPGYGESEDVKVYITTDGWVMVYYLNTEPVSKIFDWNGTTTRLEIISNQLAVVLGVINPEIHFYDFRYPNATHILLVGETRQSPAGVDTFDITYPSDYTLYETSWYIRTGGLPKPQFILDGVVIGELNNAATNQGYIASPLFVPNAAHYIGIHNPISYFGDVFGGLALVYREP